MTRASDILESAQFVVDKEGRQTAVLLDLPTWHTLQLLLAELTEDEKLGELMAAVQGDEKFTREKAEEVYQAYLKEQES